MSGAAKNQGVKQLWLVVVLAACPPTDPVCQTFPSGRPAPTSLLVMDGVPQTFSFVLDGPACQLPEGALSARPLFTSPSGETVTVGVERIKQSSDPRTFENTIEFDLVFPALTPGTYFLQLFVEPTITAIQLPVFVARDRGADAGLVVTLRERCLRPARTLAGTQFCWSQDAGYSAFRDGRRLAFPAGVDRLLPVGNVAWAIGRGDLSRFEDRPDAGLVLTATATQLQTGGGTSVDETSAIVGGVRYDFDAGSFSRRNLPNVTGNRWAEGARVMSLIGGTICDDRDQCGVSDGLARFLALDPTYLWLLTPRSTTFSGSGTFGAQELNTVSLIKRPTGPDAGVAVTVPLPIGLTPHFIDGSDLAGGLPPVLSWTPDAGQARNVLLNHGREGTSFDALPKDVLSASRDFLFVAGETPEELLVIPLPLAP